MKKSLDLKMPGIVELEKKELKSVDGGFLALLALKAYAAISIFKTAGDPAPTALFAHNL